MGMERQHFGILLREIRKDLDLSQVEFSRLIGISQGACSKLERAQADTRVDVLIKLARRCAGNRAVRTKLIRFLFRAPRMDV